jgi:type II secretory pathway component PulF
MWTEETAETLGQVAVELVTGFMAMAGPEDRRALRVALDEGTEPVAEGEEVEADLREVEAEEPACTGLVQLRLMLQESVVVQGQLVLW